MNKKLVSPQYEVVSTITGGIRLPSTTFRKAANFAQKMSIEDNVVRRVQPMHPNDLTPFRSSGALRSLYMRWQRNGFWQPTGYNKYTGRYDYWS